MDVSGCTLCVLDLLTCAGKYVRYTRTSHDKALGWSKTTVSLLFPIAYLWVFGTK